MTRATRLANMPGRTARGVFVAWNFPGPAAWAPDTGESDIGQFVSSYHVFSRRL